jgi:hypothetical protein
MPNHSVHHIAPNGSNNWLQHGMEADGAIQAARDNAFWAARKPSDHVSCTLSRTPEGFRKEACSCTADSKVHHTHALQRAAWQDKTLL